MNVVSPGLREEFYWADPFRLEDQLRLIQATAREYARGKLAAFAK
jgi:hypothetical protein